MNKKIIRLMLLSTFLYGADLSAQQSQTEVIPDCYAERISEASVRICDCLGQFTVFEGYEWWNSIRQCAFNLYDQYVTNGPDPEALTEDYQFLFKNMSLLAHRGMAGSYFRMANLFYKGIGVGQNNDSAYYYFQKSFNYGLNKKESLEKIAEIYENNSIADSRRLSSNDRKNRVYALYRNASFYGSQIGKYKLGRYFEIGSQVVKNFDSAYYYYNLAGNYDDASIRKQRMNDSASFYRPYINLKNEIINQMQLVPMGSRLIQYCIGDLCASCYYCSRDDYGNVIESINEFYISKIEVTQSQWKLVMGTNPSLFVGDNLPVHNLSWEMVNEFIRRLNLYTGHNFRLPTEAEWEYAASGCNVENLYSGSMRLDEVAHGCCPPPQTPPTGQPGEFGNNGTPLCAKPVPGKSKRPNSINLYDMSGNVSEFCSDWYYLAYNGTLSHGKSGYETSNNHKRIIKGGGFGNDNADLFKVKERFTLDANSVWPNAGFRLVMSK